MAPQPSDEAAFKAQDQVKIEMKGTGHANPHAPVVPLSEETQSDGSQIIRYATPQPLDTLIEKAKERVSDGRFHSNGWIIGNGLAKISEDGKSVTYYPPEVADLVQDLVRGQGDL